ncbi:MAG: SGNH/GDSL hydrolase family protein [Desulfatibacillum sp.]|nr:SGNH/GDSL hydrolase family protein [Desulfatibacillum sp.]
MKRLLVLGLLLIFTLIFTSPGAANMWNYTPPELENLVVFGDSLSDSGNLFSVTSGTSPDPEEYWQGRFSNGPSWPEITADMMGIENVYLLAKQQAAGKTEGKASADDPDPMEAFQTPFFFNNAYGDADSSDTETNLGWQIAFWENNGMTIPDKTLVVVWIGANDLLGMDSADNPGIYASGIVDSIYNSLKRIENLGAKYIAVCNIPDLGATPRFKGTPDEADATALTVLFNNFLESMVNKENSDNVEVSCNYVDVYTMFERVQERPAVYGISNLDQAAMGLVEDFETADDYLFWDDLHPTRTAHKQLAALIYCDFQYDKGWDGVDYLWTNGPWKQPIGLRGNECTVTSVHLANIGATAQKNRPKNSLHGLLDITVELPPGRNDAIIYVFLPEYMPSDYKCCKYVKGEWLDFFEVYQKTGGNQGARQEKDLRMVWIYLKDNGEYDLDRTVGVIRDPIAFGIVEKEKFTGSDDGGSCFVNALDDMDNPTPLFVFCLCVPLFGLGLAVRRMR